jgi:hypothetical protein
MMPSKLAGPRVPEAGQRRLQLACTDAQLLAIGDFLDRIRQLTATYADGLSRDPGAPGPAATRSSSGS